MGANAQRTPNGGAEALTLVGEEGESSPDANPAKIGRYEVLGSLGFGGMGVTFLGYDPELDRQVAIKVLRQRAGVGARTRSRMIQEAQAMAQLNHPNVVTVHDVGEHQGRVYIAMEFVDGQTLREWLNATPRPWKEILSVFQEAGRGLAAAHAAGLIHRDFKPENVMLSNEGRVFVVDFGLAQPTSESSDGGADRQRKDGGTGIVGTPGYMSPEQFSSDPLDARSDQFSFCVSLWEALYGEPPFGVGAVEALLVRVLEGRRSSPPRETRVPSRIERALVQGLSVHRGNRFASMDALLANLRPTRRWAGAQWVAGIGLVLLTAALLLPRPDPCRDAADRIDSVWSRAQKTTIRDALAATELNHAAATWSQTERRVDMWAQQWANAREEACHGDEELLDRRMSCLDAHLAELAALIKVLSEADATVAGRAVMAATELPSVAACANPPSFEQPPPEVGWSVEQVRGILRRAAALRAAGKSAQGLAMTQTIVNRALSLEYVPLAAEVQLELGEQQIEAGTFDDAAQTLAAAYWAAASLGHDEVAVRAATRLVYVVGYWLGRTDEAREWVGHARALLARQGAPDPMVAADLHRAVGHLLDSAGDLDGAGEAFVEALMALEGAVPDDHPLLARAHSDLGAILRRRGHYERAAREHERALDVLGRGLGPGHPELANTLDDQGFVFYRLERYEEAEAAHRSALRIRKAAQGPEHVRVGNTLNLLGAALYRQGKLDQARAQHERALTVLERALRPDHRLVGTTLNNVGRVALDQGDYARAIETLERAARLRHRPTSHAESAAALARALRASGSEERARVVAVDARRRLEGEDDEYAETLRRQIDAFLDETPGHDR